MGLPEFSLRQLLEAGVHYGHQTHRWDPLMQPYLYGVRNGIHIIDLTQTVPMLDAALNVVNKTVADGGSILFVGTKRQAQKPIASAANSCAQYFMNHRWLGGTLTNWNTVSNSISRLNQIDEKIDNNVEGLTKKERLNLEREQSKLQSSLGGIREMGGIPDLLFVLDTKKEALAVTEARKLGIPVVAVVDSNSNPQNIDYPIPGNDDAVRAIELYCDLIARAALDGMERQLARTGIDLGETSREPESEIISDSMGVESVPNESLDVSISGAKEEKSSKAEKVTGEKKSSKAEKVAKEEKPSKAEKVAKEEKPSKGEK